MDIQKPLIVALALCAIAFASSAQAAKPADRGDTPGLGWGPGGKDRSPIGVPGPIAGAGLPLLALVGGGYFWLRRNGRDKSKPEA
ncbi:MAG TPA: hypothetical protein VGO70_05380 [Arsenicitalea sp.]|jgi:hypothetical protein|nr:hypothetical protein [Arsenicitalea sp.]